MTEVKGTITCMHCDESHSQRVMAEWSARFGLGNGVALDTGCRRPSSTSTSISPLFPLSCSLPENMPPASTAFAMNICQPDAGGRGYIPLADHGLLVFLSSLHYISPSLHTSVFSPSLTVHPISQNRKPPHSRSCMFTKTPVVVNGR